MPRAVSSSRSWPEKTSPFVDSRFFRIRSACTVIPFTISVKRRSMWSRARKLSAMITRSTDERLMSRARLPCLLCPGEGALELGVPEGYLQPEGAGLRVHGVRAPDHRRVLVLASALAHRVHGSGDGEGDEVAGLGHQEGERGVHHVGGG